MTTNSQLFEFENLKKLLQTTNTQKALVFVSQHTDTKVLVEKLNYHGFTVATISGKLSKEERKNQAQALYNAVVAKTNLVGDRSYHIKKYGYYTPAL